MLPLVLLGCSLFGLGGGEEVSEETGTQTSSLVTEEELVTENVTYTGLLEEGGVTIYQEGSHRLMLSDGKMVILESSDEVAVPLALYVGKLVRVQGDVSPTVEAGGTLMKVRDIAWIRRESDAEGREAEVLRVICGGAAGVACPAGEVCLLEGETGICVIEEQEEEVGPVDGEEQGMMEGETSSEASSAPAMEEEGEMVEEPGSTAGTSSSASSPVQSSSSSASSQTSSSSSSSASSTSSPTATSDARVETMAEENSASERWTQQYCSTHLSFCIPVHKNWYYKSFGATASVLWHVEVGPGPIENLGDGPLHVELKTGDLSTLGVADNAVTEAGGKVIGYRTWTENRHFEISGHPSLRDSVTYITKGLRTSE
ncbi:MAG: hypothetical protein AAB853_03615 [Patescibacteria group bacterium]